METRAFKKMEEKRKTHKVILFPVPFQGHINPMIQLASILYAEGFLISIIHTRFNSPNPSNHPCFAFHSINDNLSESEACTEDVIALLSVLNARCHTSFSEKLTDLLSDGSEEGNICCLITDALWYFTQDVADSLKLPRIVIQTGNICSFLAVAVLPVLQEKGYFQIQGSQADDLVAESPPLKVKDIPMIQTSDHRIFNQMIRSVTEKVKASSGMIFNSSIELEDFALQQFLREFQIPTFLIGPFHKLFPASSSSLLAEDRSCISWLDDQEPNSVIYVSFGSLVVIDEFEFLEVAWGLSKSNTPFLWAVRPGSVRGSTWIEPLPDGFIAKLEGRAEIVKWAPQQEVLAHRSIGGFFTHCGWNSILESTCEGVPMICQPYSGDQKANARYVSDVWKIGFHLEYKIDRAEIEKTIRKLMLEIEGQEMRNRSKGLKEKMDCCLKEKGSSYQFLNEFVNHILSFRH